MMKIKPANSSAEIRRLAEAKASALPRTNFSGFGEPNSAADTKRLLHELQVHQIELEMQNAELREARDELEASLENYTDLYDFAPVGYFTLTADSSIEQANLTGAALAGMERSRLVGRSFDRLLPAGLQPEFQAFLKKALAGPARQSADFEMLQAGHLPRAINVEAQCMPDRPACRVVVKDITGRKRAEDKVRVSEIRYRRLFETAHDGVLLLDPQTGKITDANPFMTTLLDYDHAQLVGKQLFEIGLLQDEAASREMFQKLKRQHEVRYENLPLKSRKGRQQEVEVVANLYQEDARPVIQCNIRDITVRKHAEQALRASEERFRALFEMGPMAIYACDAVGVVADFNRRAVELWGRKPVPGDKDERFCGSCKLYKSGGEFMPHHRTPMADVLSGKVASVRDVEAIIERPDGSKITVVVNIRSLKNGQGKLTGAINCFYDITDRKRTEEDRQRADVLTIVNQKLEHEITRRLTEEKTLRQAEQHKSELLAQSHVTQDQLRHLSRQVLHVQEEERKRISRELHDVIAQTLTGINIRLAALKKEAGRDNKGFDRSVSRTQQLVEKSVEIVHQFARELRPTVLDDLGLIPALHTFMKDFTAATGVHARLTAFAQVEQMATDRRTVLFRIAQESLTNVARHAKAARVEVNIQKLADGVCMKIKDDGKSFQAARALKAKCSKRLGLLGMRERLEMHGGTLKIESAPGKGTTIIAMIPFGKTGGGADKLVSVETKKL